MLDELRCGKCGATLTGDAVEPATGLISCPSCRAVYVWRPLEPVAAAVEPAVKPARFVELERSNGLQISWHWPRPNAGIIFFALFWNGFMTVWYMIAFTQRIWPMALFGLLHLGVGLALIYGIVCGFLNRTFIRVGHDWLEVRHLPIRARGNRRLELRQIAELEVKNATQASEGVGTPTFAVMARLENGSAVELVGNLPEVKDALYLVQRLRPWLEGERAGRL